MFKNVENVKILWKGAKVQSLKIKELIVNKEEEGLIVQFKDSLRSLSSR